MNVKVSENYQPPTRAFGRTLSDLWLKDGTGISDPHDPPRYGPNCRLLPGEWELLRFSASGEPCVLGTSRPSAGSSKNTIRAGLLRFIALGGDEQHYLHEHGVQLVGAFVGCDGGELDFEGAVLPENFSLRRCKIDGDINVHDAMVETFILRGCQVEGLAGGRMEATGSVILDKGFKARGNVYLSGSKISGVFSCVGGSFEHQDVALEIERVKIEGAVFLSDGFEARGSVLLLGAKIAGNLECRNGGFLCSEIALDVEGAQIDGALFIDHGFLAMGQVDLTDVSIGTSLSCTGGTFSGPQVAINAPNAKIGNSVYLNKDCRVLGEVSFQAAEIGDSITFQGGSFETKGMINLRNAKIGNMLTWRGVSYMRGELSLAGASCKALNMDNDAWKMPKQILLDNFTYQRFAELPEGCTVEFWKIWLERQPKRHLVERFKPAPYQQLSNVLVSMGHEEEARAIRIERRELQRVFTRDYVPKPQWTFPWLLRVLADLWRLIEKYVTAHGYRPGLAVFWLLGLVVIGAGIYHTAAVNGIMTPTHPLIYKEAIWEPSSLDQIVAELKAGNLPPGKAPAACRENWVHPPENIKDWCAASVPSEYSTFNALVYSLDTAIPVVNFRMEDDWSPRVVHWKTGKSDWAGWFVRSWEWLQIALGWAFSLLFVSAISGVIRRD